MSNDDTPLADDAAGRPFGLSSSQRAIWFDQQFAPDSVRYHISHAVRVRLASDPEVIRRALQHVMDVSPMLRATFTDVDGEPVQTIVADMAADVRFVDASEDAPIEELLRDEHLRPFDLTAGPPVRFLVVADGPTEHLVVIVVHHLVSDLWSQALLGHRLAETYRNALHSAPLPEPTQRSTYREFVIREQERITGAEGAAALEFWRPVFESWVPQSVPSDRGPRPDPSGVGAVCDVELEADLVGGLERFADDHGVSLRSALMAAYMILLQRYAGSEQVVVAETKANRSLRLADVVGCCVNQVPRSAAFDSATTFASLVTQIDQDSRAARPHESAPFEYLLHELRPAHGTDPFFEASFAWQKTSRLVDQRITSALVVGDADPPTHRSGAGAGSGAATVIAGLAVHPVAMPTRSAPIPLTLLAVERDGGLHLTFEYQTDRFDQAGIELLGRHLKRVMISMVEKPHQHVGDIDLVDDDERERRECEWASVERPVAPDLAVHRLIERQAERSPDATAVTTASESFTYRELDDRANALAHRLVESGAGGHDLVGICLDRSIDMVASMLAVWKAGAGYVPMDPAFPADRLATMVADAELDIVLTSPDVWQAVMRSGSEDAEAVLRRPAPIIVDQSTAVGTTDPDLAAPDPTSPDVGPPEVAVVGADVAYVIFTSGSTGRPKGVVVEHGNVVNFVDAMTRRPGLDASDVVLASTTLSFDISVLELVVPLTVGAQIMLVDRDVVLDPPMLADALGTVTVAQGTPTMWKMLVESGWAGENDLTVLCGGEPLGRALADALLERCGSLWNMYGPTETTVWSTAQRVLAAEGPVPIGDPIDNTRLVVLDDRRRPVPEGIAGELWVGGAGVARGYIGRPDLTAERFVEDAVGRLYRTGDLVRRRADRGIEFLGRVDDQIKLRGHRIELGEIEAVISDHALVVDAVAAVREFGPDDLRLVVYYRPAAGRADDVSRDGESTALRAHARTRLPGYMVPVVYVPVDAFPRTPNDKVDRARLPDPAAPGADGGAPPKRDGILRESTVDTQIVLEVYRDVLGSDAIGADDDFFALGGHSLLATRIVSRLRRRLGSEIPLRWIFEHPTVADLARVIPTAPPARAGQTQAGRAAPRPGELLGDSAGDSAADAAGPSRAGDDVRTFALSSSQERMWLLHAMRPESPAYNLSGLALVRGDLDIAEFHRAIDRVVERHTSLRSVFVEIDGRPRTRIRAPFHTDFSVIDLRRLRHEDRVEEAGRRAERVALRPFRLDRLPLFRFSAYRVDDDEHVVALVMHHVIADQWSFGVLMSELVTLVERERTSTPSPLAPAPRPELYAEWQRRELQSAAVDEHLGYWRDRLRDVAPLDLPADRARSAFPSMRGSSITAPLPDRLSAAVAHTARRHRASEFMVEFAAFQVLLSRMTGQTDIAIGVPIANRHWLESESLITSLVNTLVLRSDLSRTRTFDDLVEQVRDTTLDAYAHQDLPFERLVAELAPARDPSRSPLFQVFFNVQNAPFDIPPSDGFDITILPARRHVAQFDLAVTIDSTVTGTVTVEYATDLFDRERIERLLDDYLGVLADVTGPHGGGTVLGGSKALDVATSDVSTPVAAAVVDPVRSDRDEAPRPGLERQIAGIWETALATTGIRRHDDFFELGGHSILAVRIFAALQELNDRPPPMSTLFRAPTVAGLTRLLDAEGWTTPWTSLVEVRPGTERPFFYVSPFLISVLSFHDLAEELGGDRPFFAFQPQGIETDDPVHQRVEDMAAHYIREMKTVQPEGPYLLGGHCAGGWVAFEMVRQLQAMGDEIEGLVVVDVDPPGIQPPRRRWLRFVVSRLVLYGRGGRILDALRWKFDRWMERIRTRSAGSRPGRIEHLRRLHAEAHGRYEGGTIAGDLTFVRSEEWSRLPDKAWHLDWRRLISGRLDVEVIPGAHAMLLDTDSVVELATVLRRVLDDDRRDQTRATGD